MATLSECEYAGRVVRVRLPPGYDEARTEPYPLLLMQDGQNLFGDTSTARDGGSWRAGEAMGRLVAAGRIPPLVVAGIDHAKEDRINEFTPTSAGRAAAGRATEYARVVVVDLLPQLAADFHVRADAEGLGLGGSSMGALVTLWIAMTFPGRFGRLLVMSPSLWWDRRVVLRRLRQHPLDPGPRIWLDAGRKEGQAVVRDARELRTLLRREGHTVLRYLEDPEGDHSEVSWGRRFPEAMEWLYGIGRRTP